ncbi:NAD(P)/FAD-dependent oxidoreductase [Mucilaginibacter sp. X4EP1]|uniref:NAD(P)/FAD-dependent oxidoreductase n=1 Tax=Mucilaginibacter sp. X4EP1 TaxID=2723092 RepID=UPI0021672D99|nr:tryptophan 7-halogenase [Mucilaginibacter sp. X4EP1]MCS3814648.1 FADH2 O2-dependent halogenase [Mucilaginibacter sp. X4EP1]
MPEREDNHYDILIAGGGFAGSLTALILHNQGFKVCLVEKGQHPRFAIGESSTPIADMQLRDIAVKYNLPWLFDFSRYGSWQQSHPEIVCGLKRGFSFFKHYPGQNFTTDTDHVNELLVAASVDDIQSDTNWLRADFDAFLVDKVKEAGINYFDLTEIIAAKRETQWEFKCTRHDEPLTIHSAFLIDATGSGVLIDNLFGVKSSSDSFLTDSFAVFSHFNGIARWTELLKKAGIPTDDFPYDPDNSALHQILDEGWIWMLRFNDQRTSFGFALSGREKSLQGLKTQEIWDAMLKKYPGINQVLEDSVLAPVPGKIIQSGRLQRKVDSCFGTGWAVLPHTAGFVDPLFSSGIAHSLAGMQKLVTILGENFNNPEPLYVDLQQYEDSVFAELKLIDQLVAGCYLTMAHFKLFNAWSMLYFAATIAHEQRLLKKLPAGCFLGADDEYITNMVQEIYTDLLKIIDSPQLSDEDVTQFTNRVRERIKPLNTAGLLDVSLKNMYRHTAAEL